MIELTITVSDSESKLIHKHLVPEGICISHDDPEHNRLVKEAVTAFGKDVEDCVIKFKADW